MKSVIPRKAASDICAPGCYLPHLCSGRRTDCLMRPKAYYPIFTDLNGRRCVVIGGGMIAQRKVTTLLSYGAKITVVSPTLTARLKRYAAAGKIASVRRKFRPADLSGAWLVYASTDDQAINERVFATASRGRIFTNVVDQGPLCSFIAPAILRKDPLTIAISTGGASPSVAKRLRAELSESIGVDYPRLLRLLRDMRGVAKKVLPKYGDRKVFFDSLVRGRVFDLVREGKLGMAKKEALAQLERFAEKNGA